MDFNFKIVCFKTVCEYQHFCAGSMLSLFYKMMHSIKEKKYSEIVQDDIFKTIVVSKCCETKYFGIIKTHNGSIVEMFVGSHPLRL